MCFTRILITSVVSIGMFAIVGLPQNRTDQFSYRISVPHFFGSDVYSSLKLGEGAEDQGWIRYKFVHFETVSSVGSKGRHLADSVIGYSERIAPLLMAIAALFGVFVPARQYVKTQRSELRWRRFQTTWNFWRDFLSDKEILEVVQHIEERSEKLEALFDDDFEELSEEQYDLRRKVDRYFEYLEGLVFAVKSETLLKEDVAVFGWHFDQFVEYDNLANYCRKRAYSAVPKFAEKFVNRKPLFNG